MTRIFYGSKGSPYVELCKLQGKIAGEWKPRWMDHVSVSQKDGQVIYISEPYEIDSEAFEDFLLLRSHGWRVRVDGQSKHYPGRTVRVRISREVTP